MRITRRQFIKYVSAMGAALGLSQTTLDRVIEAVANPGGLKVVWLSGQACGGCIEAASNMFIGEADVADGNGDNVYDNLGIAQVKALLEDPYLDRSPFSNGNLSSSTTVEDVLIDVIDLKLMPVIDTPSGDLWMSVLKKYMDGVYAGNFVFVVEGSIPTDLNMDYVDYCIIGNKYWDADKVLGIGEAVYKLATTGGALAGIAYGTCAAYGNIPAAKNRKYNPATGQYEHTFAMGVSKYLQSKGVTDVPVVNIPNCPGHPEALALTVVDVILQGLAAVAGNLDSYGRPKSSLTFGFPIYSHTIHQDCPRLSKYYNGIFSNRFGDKRAGCLELLGCQGQWVNAPCHTLGWNRQYSKTSCIIAGMPCTGCSEPGFPDRTMKYNYTP